MNVICQVEVKPIFADYLRLNLHVIFRRLRVVAGLAVFSLLGFLLGLPWMPFEGNPDLLTRYRGGLPLLILPGIVFILLPLSVYWDARRRWKSADELREVRRYQFTESDIEVLGTTFSGRTDWKNIIRAERAGPLILLVTSQQAFYIIPIRAFPNTSEAEKFRRWLKEKIPNCTRLG